MKYIPLGKSGLTVPTIGIGCMRISQLDKSAAEHHIRTAMELGANFFDHADIYGGGFCEQLFADVIQMNSSIRESMILQSKCGIRPGQFDFSREHILNSVDGILKRLNTEYLDILLLHRPDTLMEPEEVAEAFSTLRSSGKVRHFGVSNQTPYQMMLLEKYMDSPLVANQLQLSPTNATMISQGLHTNMLCAEAQDRDGGVLDFCRLHDITIQPWSPFQHGNFAGPFLGNDQFPELNTKLQELAEKYGTTPTGMVVAWLLRHPAKFQPIIGTTNLERLKECIHATDITITRKEWYEIYLSAGNFLP